ncbi:pyridoxal 5'-phosphate synthase, synthase subunit Pdx1 [Batrachochytrium salamandrivorans]|nr:pyridoxal 5'-phosphate synthase, synthase subunit Pdx1 [Batrachochytrium salamandrivorans]
MSIKFTNEPPQGVKAGPQKNICMFTTRYARYEFHDLSIMPLLYGLAFLHSIVQERRKFGPLGCELPYEFNQSDLAAMFNLCKTMWTSLAPKPPFLGITARFMFCEVHYGGRVTDLDRRLLKLMEKSGLGGVIMDVINAEQARIAEEAGACAVMALERVPADIRKDGGVARMSDPDMIKKIMAAVTIPVMAKVRIGHFVEAQILEHIGIDYIDESEVLTPADEMHHIDKNKFKVPARRALVTVVEAVRHARTLFGEIRRAQAMTDEELYTYAKDIQAPYHLLKETARLGRLPVVNFAAGGVATPADAALMMQLGVDGVFVGSGIFKSGDPAKRARAIVQAVTHFNDPSVIASVSENLGEAMVGINCDTLPADQKFATRGW